MIELNTRLMTCSEVRWHWIFGSLRVQDSAPRRLANVVDLPLDVSADTITREVGPLQLQDGAVFDVSVIRNAEAFGACASPTI